MTDYKPSHRAQIVVSTVVTVLALVLFGAGRYFAASAVRSQIGRVDAAKALDVNTVPARSFVRISGRVDENRVAEVEGKIGGTHDRLFSLEGVPRIVFYCPTVDQCADSLDAALRENREQEFSGRVYEYGEYVGTHGKALPRLAINEFIAEDPTLDPASVRIIHTGETAKDLFRSATIAYVFSAILGLGAVFLWFLTWKRKKQKIGA